MLSRQCCVKIKQSVGAIYDRDVLHSGTVYIGIALGTAVICPGLAMAAVIPEKVHFEPGPEALKVSAELSREPSLIAVSWIKLYDGVALEF